jgi:hypothetical protein
VSWGTQTEGIRLLLAFSMLFDHVTAVTFLAKVYSHKVTSTVQWVSARNLKQSDLNWRWYKAVQKEELLTYQRYHWPLFWLNINSTSKKY